jgi:hypothetical protein
LKMARRRWLRIEVSTLSIASCTLCRVCETAGWATLAANETRMLRATYSLLAVKMLLPEFTAIFISCSIGIGSLA